MMLPSALRGPLALPVLCSPMFIASGPELVIAQRRAGLIGSFPSLNAREASEFDDWLDQIEDAFDAATPAPAYAVNQIIHASNVRLEKDIQICVDHRVPIVITSLGAREDVYDTIHSYGGVVLHDVVNDRFAHKAIEKGADGVIAVAAGAGGHGGAQSPFALVREIRRWFDGPLLLGGAIAHGSSILAAEAAGADLAYVGSAFLATAEANTVPAYKDMVVRSNASDIVYSNHFTGVPGNYLRGSIQAAGLDPDALGSAAPGKLNFGADAEDGPKVWRDIWSAGHGIGAIERTEAVAGVVERLEAEYLAARRRLQTTNA